MPDLNLPPFNHSGKIWPWDPTAETEAWSSHIKPGWPFVSHFSFIYFLNIVTFSPVFKILNDTFTTFQKTVHDTSPGFSSSNTRTNGCLTFKQPLFQSFQCASKIHLQSPETRCDTHINYPSLCHPYSSLKAT